jgi:cysteine desulfurase/selenocysteine lyase
MDLDIDRIRFETPGVSHSTHLLAAGSALMPQPVIDAVIEHTELEAKFGGYEAYGAHAESLDRAYDSIASLIGAKPREIAVMENATVAWCHAFYALPLAKGSRILTCEAEYGANYVAFLQRAKRENLTIDVVPNDATGQLDVDALEAMIDDTVSLIAITWIPTNGGLVNPAAGIGKIARKHNIPYLLDACQAVGQMPVNVAEIGCDFLSSTGRKFLRGPRGTGFLYVRETWLETLEPAMIDFFGAPWTSTNTYGLRDDARRFETWENAYALRAGLVAATDYATSIGLDAIQSRSWRLAEKCREMLGELPGVQLRDLGRTPCAIISFTVEGLDAQQVVADLRAQSIIIGASAPSSTRLDAKTRNLPVMLRLAPHYYNTSAEIERFIGALRGLAK